MLKLTFLGTSAGVPTKDRNVTALAVECLNPYLSHSKASHSKASHSKASASQPSKKSRPWLLIDCGEGTQQQLLRTTLSVHQLAAICITHVHGDHCYGLPGLLASSAMSGRSEPLTIIAPQAIAQLIEAVKVTTDLYLPYTINFIAIEEVLSQAKDSQDNKIRLKLTDQHHIDIDITLLSHRVPSHAFGMTQKISRRTLNTDKLIADGVPASKIWGQLQQGEDVYTKEGKRLYSADYVNTEEKRTRIVVAGDNDTPTCLQTALQDTDLLVHEATYTTQVLAKIQAKNLEFDPMHSSAALIGQFAQDRGVPNLILTHFSARFQSFDNPDSRTPNMGHIRTDAQSTYQGNLWLAADFAQYLVEGADRQVTALGSTLDSGLDKLNS
ncbi:MULTISPECIES: MBL fold metallo-hydrolase [unclassified Psychrobacter]|uniref:MBL fold metallo-hydrolase n=1 Tax=unclassified Psychrobacter TaxID=196806 RepID=UPI003FD0DC76